MIISILLYFSSFDEVSGDHKIGDNVIHKNLYELKIKSSPPGLEIDGSGIFEDGTWIVTGAAQQKWGAYEFVGWMIDGNWVDGNPITVLMDTDHTVIGMYSFHPVKKQDSLNFKESNNKNTIDLLIISPYGKTTGSGSYSDKEIVDFSVSERYVYDEIYDGVRYAFSGWSDGNTPNLMSNFIKMNDTSTTITANWLKQYRLEIFDSIQNKNIIKTSWLDVNSTAPLVIDNFEPRADGQVKRTINKWISIGSNYAEIEDSKLPITSIKMENPYAISIDWKNQFYLDVNSKYGKVVGSGFYDEGDVVVASIDSDIQNTGLAGTRLIFDGWQGDVNSNGANVQVIMDSPKSLEGVWKKQFQLTVNSEYGISSGAGWYNEGDVATFGTNIPRDPAGLWQQNTFQGWSGDIETQSNTGSILMNGPKMVTAKWNVDYFIAFLNIGLISSTAIGGLFIYKKMKNRSKQEKSLQKDLSESLPTKTKKQTLSGLTKELSTKINSKMNFSDNQETIENNKLEQILDDIELQKEKLSQGKEQLEKNIDLVELQKKNLSQKTEQLEKSVTEVEFERRKIGVELEKGLTEMELEKKKIKIELENNLAEVELQKKNLSQKTEQLEKSVAEVEFEKRKIEVELEKGLTEMELEKKKIKIELENNLAEVELQKKNLSQKIEQLEKSVVEVEFEKREIGVELEMKVYRVELERKELERKYGEVELQKKNLSQKIEQLEKSVVEVDIEKDKALQEKERLEKNIAAVDVEKRKIAAELEKGLTEMELEKKKIRIKLENNLAEVELQKKNLSQKTEQLEKSVVDVEFEKKEALQEKERLEKMVVDVDVEKKKVLQEKERLEKSVVEGEFEKRKIIGEFERKVHAVEFEKKRLGQKAWDLEKRIGKFTLEMNISVNELEKKRIVAELERKELVIELEKEGLAQRKKELEKRIAAVEIERDITPTEIKIQENTKLNKKNIIAEIELARKISTVELERKESIIELEKKNLATKTEMLEKKISGVETERKISFVQLERIKAEIELEKKNWEQRTMEFGKNTASRNTDLTKKDLDYSYSILDSEHNSYEKFRQWADVLENELAIKETSDKKNSQGVYLEDMK